MRYVLIMMMVLVPSVVLAAYQNPTVLSNERQGSGSVAVLFQFTGDAGEPIAQRTFVVQQATTLKALREWVKDTIDELDAIHAAATLPTLQAGQTVTKLNRVNPAKAAREAWFDTFSTYVRMKDAGIAAMASDLAVLKTWLENNYQSGYVAP